MTFDQTNREAQALDLFARTMAIVGPASPVSSEPVSAVRAAPFQLTLDFDLIFVPATDEIAPNAREATRPPSTIIGPSCPSLAVLIDHSLAGGRDLAVSWKGRARDNVEAIKLLNLLDREQRPATPPEQALIAKFVGFGASELANAIFANRSSGFREGWEDLGTALIAETTGPELQALKRATQYAHYTPEYIVRAMWGAVQVLGFTGGQILEPGCGSGLFMGLRPDTLSRNSVFVGIENDPVTAGIARALYPNQLIRCIDFDKASLPNDFDLAIGNPPFSNLSIHNKTNLGRLGLSLHDFFIAKSLEHLRPGGIAMFVTSRYTLDKSDPKARHHIDAIADFLGAVPFPARP